MNPEDDNGTTPAAPKAWLPAADLHRLSGAEALALVDEQFGSSDGWTSELMRYRLTSDYQADWKEEIGHWLDTAGRHGFLAPLLHRILTRAKVHGDDDARNPNDAGHQILAQELAPAMVVHHLTGTGWGFSRWEPKSPGGIDVDVELSAPDGTAVQIQVKAPDQPGRHAGCQLVDGEYDARVVTAVHKAAGQLPRDGPETKLIFVCANRELGLATEPACLVTELIGATMGDGVVVYLPRSKLGAFFRPEWAHVGAVVLLDFVRSFSGGGYACTVLTNPEASVPADRAWFPRGRVCLFDGRAFRWTPDAPGITHTLPDGTCIRDDAG